MDNLIQDADYNEEQIRALYDPIRIRIASCLKKPHTPKQVAEILNIRPNNLYHHFRVLKKAGIIEHVETKKGKGFIKEDYYRLSLPEIKTHEKTTLDLHGQQFYFGLFQALMDDFKTTAARYEKPYALGVREDFRFKDEDLEKARYIVERHCELMAEEIEALSDPDIPASFQLSIFSFKVWVMYRLI